MNSLYILFVCLILMLSCSDQSQTYPNLSVGENHRHFLIGQGQWLGELSIKKNKKIPFNFEVKKDSVFIINSEERIGAKISSHQDSMRIKIPVFDSELRFIKTRIGLAGYWHNNTKTRHKLPFCAHLNKKGGKHRFNGAHSNNHNLYSGNWETTFSKGTENEYKSVAIFHQDKEHVTGTFITETGDYRFLQGNVYNDSIFLSCFDGAHAFLFEGRLVDNIIHGMFYSGLQWSEPWISLKNDSFALTNPYLITQHVPRERLEFSFPSVDGGILSYPNKRFNNKVVIIQILGSWCPNCVDETKFFSTLYNQYQDRGLEIIGLAFESPKKLIDKIARVKDLKSHTGSKYEFLIAGSASKKEAQKALPFLNEISSFPTTMFIGKKGAVRKIHTGFYGPGTGEHYVKYTAEVGALVEALLSE